MDMYWTFHWQYIILMLTFIDLLSEVGIEHNQLK